MCLKLAVIYGTINEHEKANIGFKHCILAQEEKMIKSGKFSNSLSRLLTGYEGSSSKLLTLFL